MKARWMLGLVCALGAVNAAATDLLQVYDRATVTDPLIKQAAATHLAVREIRTQALIGLLPIDLSANKYWQNVGSLPITTPATASLSLAVNLFSWNSWVALKSADASVAQGEANYLAAQQSLVQRVTAQYFAVLAAQDTLSAQLSALQSVQIQLDQAEQRFNVGLIAITDVEIARASRDNTNAAVIAAKHHDVAHQRQVRALDLADARAGSALHPVTGVEVLFLGQSRDLAPFHNSEAAVLLDALGHHGVDALTDVLLRSEDGLHGGHHRRVVEVVDRHRFLRLGR